MVVPAIACHISQRSALYGCQSRVGGHCTRELHGAAAVGSIVKDGQSIGSEVAAAVTRYLVEAPG